MGNGHPSHDERNDRKEIGQRAVKIIVVGDNMGGLKTRWLMTYTNNGKEISYLPAAFENYNANVQYKGVTVIIDLWDTTGQEEYDRLRPLTYPQTSVVIMLYNRQDKKSLSNLKDIWLPELFRFIPTVPIILVETDFPLEYPATPVSNEDAELMRTDRVIVPFSLEKTSFSDWKTVKRVIEEKALEAVEFSLSLPDLSFETFSKEVKAKYKAELKRLKAEAQEAEKSDDEESARAKENLTNLQTKIDREIFERSVSSKFDLYAEHLGWK